MSWLADVCTRCNTTHPANDAGERICPAPPIERAPEAEHVMGDTAFIPCIGMFKWHDRLPPLKIDGKPTRIH